MGHHPSPAILQYHIQYPAKFCRVDTVWAKPLKRETMPLTDTAIKKAKTKSDQYRMTDGGGLYLLVHPRGAKYWRYDFKVGTRKTMALGQYPEVSLLEARQKHAEAKLLVVEGKDPIEAAKCPVADNRNEGGERFGVIADDYVRERLIEADPPKAQVTIDKNKYLLENLAKPIRDTPIRDLTAADILKLIKGLEVNGQIETAHRLRPPDPSAGRPPA